MGAHFALYKPISTERAKASFRAARALMKRERRRNSRLPVQIPVSVSGARIGSNQQALTVDFSEGGMAVQFKYRVREGGALNFAFSLPGVSERSSRSRRDRVGEPQQSTRNSVCKRRPGPQASSQNVVQSEFGRARQRRSSRSLPPDRPEPRRLLLGNGCTLSRPHTRRAFNACTQSGVASGRRGSSGASRCRNGS